MNTHKWVANLEKEMNTYTVSFMRGVSYTVEAFSSSRAIRKVKDEHPELEFADISTVIRLK